MPMPLAPKTDVETALTFISLINQIKAFIRNHFPIKPRIVTCPTCISTFDEFNSSGETPRDRIKEYTLAEELFSIKQRDPRSVGVSYLLTMIYFRLGEKSSAIQHANYFKKIVEGDSRLSLIANNLLEKVYRLP